MDKNTESFLEQYKSLREEIHIRIRQHTQFVIIKLIALGAVFSFFIEKLNILPSSNIDLTDLSKSIYIWIIPLIALIIDVMVAGNLRAIRNLGVYIMNYVEPVFRENSHTQTKWWEETVASAKRKNQCYRTEDVIYIWLVSFISIIIIGYVRWKTGFTIIDWIFSISEFILSILVLMLLIKSLTRKRDFEIK